MVDVTAALRKNQINPRDSKGDLRTDVLKVMVHSLDGTLLELQDTPAASRLDTDGDGKVSFEEFEGRPASSLAALQFPVLKGPRFAMTNNTLRATADGDADPDAGMLRALLASARLMPAKEADTATETAAIKKLQQATHLRVTGKDNDLDDTLHGRIQLNNVIASGWSIAYPKFLMKRPKEVVEAEHRLPARPPARPPAHPSLRLAGLRLLPPDAGIADPATKRALLVAAGLREDGNGAGLEIKPK